MVQNIKTKKKLKTIDEIGWEVIPTNNLTKLIKLRKSIYKIVKEVFELKEANISKGLNHFHK